MSDLTNGQKEDFLQAAIKSELIEEDDDGYRWCYIGDWTDSWVVYETNAGCFEIAYSMDDAGAVTFSGEPKAKVAQTTYVDAPEGEQLGSTSPMMRRGFAMQEGLAIRGERLAPFDGVVKSEPLTYHEHAPHSFYRDMILTDRVPGASERLARHRQEMDVLAKEREARAWRSLHEGKFETRVTPNTTDGTGGYMAPPAWVNDLTAMGKRPGRVLSRLVPRFDLPGGVSSINLPLLSTATVVQPVADNAGVADQDIIDAAGTSIVATLAGQADVALQLLEQSPAGAHLDWIIFKDLAEAYDYDLETQLENGSGSASNQLLGLMNAGTGKITVSYTDASPTGSELWPFFGQAFAQLGNNRLLPPEVWLMRSARWGWLNGAEDTATRPFGLPSPFFMGNTDSSPDPVGGLLGLPTFLTEAIPATTGVASNQDVVISTRPSDLLLFESAPQTSIMREPGSGNLGVRLQLRGSAAFIIRYPQSVALISGTGMVVQSGYAT